MELWKYIMHIEWLTKSQIWAIWSYSVIVIIMGFTNGKSKLQNDILQKKVEKEKYFRLHFNLTERQPTIHLMYPYLLVWEDSY